MYRFVKRAFDFIASLLALVVTSPIWLITVIGIELSDPGPVFYKSIRIGYLGKEFHMYKFRSMRVPKTESEKSEASFKADVNRVFKFGAFIRRAKIDELPQLLNIITGKMAIIGPRPATKEQVSVMREGKYAIANTIRPGLSGPAALYDYIYGDVVESPEDYKKLVLPTRRELEAYYPFHMSAKYDIQLICWTVICILNSLTHRKQDKIFNKLVGCVVSEKQEITVQHV